MDRQITTADGATWLYEYDDRGNMVAAVDPCGARTTYTHGECGRIRSITDALGRTTVVETKAAGLPSTITDPVGGRTALTWCPGRMRAGGLMAYPTLVAVSGAPGAGKTTLAHALADALGWPAVCRDEIKERMAAAGVVPAGQLDLKTLEAFFHTLAELLRSGTSVVAEAAFQDRLWRPGLEPLRALADIRVLRCVVDPELARLRIDRRAAEQPSRAVHADVDLLRRITAGQRPLQSWVPISLDVPNLIVDTAQDWQPPLARIIDFATHTPQPIAGD